MNKAIARSFCFIIDIIEVIPNIINKIIGKKPELAGIEILNIIAIQYCIKRRTNPIKTSQKEIFPNFDFGMK